MGPLILSLGLALAAAPYAEEIAAVQAARADATALNARATFTRELRERLIPPWFGTTWGFYGTTQIPGEGEIACGYFVTTLLRDMGVKLRRVHLAQQASENLIKALVPKKRIKRFSNRSPSDVVDWVEKQGPGVYIVGLDYHVGFLIRHQGVTEMCHSSVLAPGSVVCEDARKSEAMVSGYHVVGEATNPRLLKAWRTASVSGL